MAQADYVSHLSVDNVIFGYHEKEIKVLLLRAKGNDFFMLPGGFVKSDETIRNAAKRVAFERTGMKDLYLKQFKTYGSPERNQEPNLVMDNIMSVEWMFDGKMFNDLSNQYFVSIGYYTLTEFSQVDIQMGEIDEECKWFSLDEIPQLLYDHNLLLNDALIALRLHVNHYPIGKRLLESKFTIPELQALYETILNKSLDRRNFSKKIINSGILNKLDEQKKIGAHRSPNLYEFNEERYFEALENGLVLFH